MTLQVVRSVFAQPIFVYSIPHGGPAPDAHTVVAAAFSDSCIGIVEAVTARPAELHGEAIDGAQYVARLRALVAGCNALLRAAPGEASDPIDPLAMIEAQIRADADAALRVAVAPTVSDLYRGEAAVRALCTSYLADVLASFTDSTKPWANIGGITAAVRRAVIDIPIDALEARLIGDDDRIGEQLAFDPVSESQDVFTTGEYHREVHRKTRWHRFGYRDTVTAGHFRMCQTQTRITTTYKNGRVDVGAWTNAGVAVEVKVGEHSYHTRE